ncbi:MAG TPA: GIY-YIG nuclease family protein [Xanthomonadaceae bacterium]|nr:GIY-YIG nuclease family protein [Xanthomonadaceae bacterium]
MPKQPAVYILATKLHGTMYIGATSELIQRTWQHKEHFIDGFTKRYGITRLVWFEMHETMEGAITREKQLKKWKRDWKIHLVEETNPRWDDLYEQIV